MPTKISILLSAQGGPAVQAAIRSISADGKALEKQLDADAKAAQQLATALTKGIKDGASSTWSPAISAAQKHAAELRKNADDVRALQAALINNARQQAIAAKQAADAQKQATKQMSDAQKEAAKQTADAQKQAAKQAADAQKQASKQVQDAINAQRKAAHDLTNQLVKAGAASHWSPAISAAQKAKAALQQTAQAGNQAGNSISLGFIKADSAAGRLLTKMHAINRSMKDSGGDAKMSALSGALTTGQGVASRVMLGAGAGLALQGKTGLDAGEFNKIQNSFRRALGKEAGDEFLQTLQKSDFARVFGVRETLKQAQSAITVGGMSPDDLLNKKGNGLFQTVGAMAAEGGGSADGVIEAMRQINQIKKKGQAEKNDLDVIAESGGIDIYGLISAKFGQARTTEVLKGEKPLTYAELEQTLQSIPEYKGGQFKNSLGDAANALPGQIKALDGALFNLSQTLGQYVVPTLSLGVKLLTSLANMIAGFPEPIKAAIAYGGMLIFGLALITSAIVTAGIGAGLSLIAWRALTFELGLNTAAVGTNTIATGRATFGISGLATALLSRFIPALAAAKAAALSPIGKGIGAVGLGIGAGALAYDQLQKRGVLGEEAAPLGDAVSNTFGRAGAFFRTGQSSNYDKEMQQKWAITRQKEALAAKEEAKEGVVQAVTEAAPTIATTTPSTSFALPTSATASLLGEGADLGGAGAFEVDNTSIIRALEKQKRGLKGKENASRRADLTEQITSLRQQQQDANKNAAELRKAQAQQKREEGATVKAKIADVNSARDMAVSDRNAQRDADLARLREQHEDEVAALRRTANKFNRAAIAERVREMNREYQRAKDRISEDARREVNGIKSGAIREGGALKAGTQSGVFANATMAIANARAGALGGGGRYGASMGLPGGALAGAGAKIGGAYSDSLSPLQKLGNLKNSSRVAALMAEAAKTNDPEQQQYLIRQASRLMDSTIGPGNYNVASGAMNGGAVGAYRGGGAGSMSIGANQEEGDALYREAGGGINAPVRIKSAALDGRKVRFSFEDAEVDIDGLDNRYITRREASSVGRTGLGGR